MKTEIKTITPEVARIMLGTNKENNRALNEKTVKFYAHQMTSGQWKLTGEAIKISSAGVLIDGQHRLNALIRANKSIDFLIVYDIDDSAFAYIDTGLTRSPGDLFKISGIDHYNVKSSIVSAYIGLCKGVKSSHMKEVFVTKNDVLKTYRENQTIFDEITHTATACYSKRRMMLQSQIGGIAAYLILSKKHRPERVLSFFKQLFQIQQSENKTIDVLRDKLIDAKLTNVIMSYKFRLAIIAKTWNCFVRGKEISVLAWNEAREGEIKFL